jgi:hypothetical protein
MNQTTVPFCSSPHQEIHLRSELPFQRDISHLMGSNQKRRTVNEEKEFVISILNEVLEVLGNDEYGSAIDNPSSAERLNRQ